MKSFEENIISIKKKDDIVYNVSDHYPITLLIKYEDILKRPVKEIQTKLQLNRKTNWEKVDKDRYKELVSSKIHESTVIPKDHSGIVSAFNKVNEIMALSAKNCDNTVTNQPRSKKNSRLKIVTPEIWKAMKEKKEAFLKWKMKGSPQIPNDTYLLAKKSTTYKLRTECRIAEAKKRIAEREEILNARTSNKALFYRLIRKKRGHLSSHIDELNVGSTVYTTENGILEGWRQHFAKLAQEEKENKVGSEYLELVDTEYQHIIDICKKKSTTNL